MHGQSTAVTSHQRARNGEHDTPRERPVNVGEIERWVSLAVGGALALYGLRRSLWGLTLAFGGGALVYRGLTGHCPVYNIMGLNTASGVHAGVRIEDTVTINRPRADVYRFWRNLENLPRFMTHLESVTNTGGGRSRWVARLPMQTAIAWNAEITAEREDEFLAWRSLPGADVEHNGSVYFREAPGGRGTEVQVTLAYYPPGGVVGATLGMLLNAVTAQQIKEDLRRLKQAMEAGESPTIAGQPAGHRTRT